MNRLLLSIVMLTAVANLGFVQSSTVHASGSPAAPGTYDVGGTVYAIDWTDGYVIIETQKGCYQATYPDTNTVVTVRGVPATLANITVGSRIRSSNSLTTGHALAIDLR